MLSILTVATATRSVSSHENPPLAPPFRRPAPPSFPVVSVSLLETASSHPAHAIPVPTESGAIEVGEVIEAEDPDMTESKEARPWTATAAAEVIAESNGDYGGSAARPETPPSPVATQDPASPEEQHVGDQPGFTEMRGHNAKDDVPLSNRIHIIGFNSQARLFAYALASMPDVPIDIMAHHDSVVTRWGEEHRRLSLYDARGRYVSSVPIPCPESVRGRRKYVQDAKEDFLDNIIIDTRTTAVLPSLKALSRRIDRQTTICLLHPGLGLVEELNEEIFTDPFQRPNLIITHSTHKVAKVSSSLYSVRQKKSGVLYLHSVDKFDDPALKSSPIAVEGVRQSQHLMRLLSSNEIIKAVSLPWVRFLSWKLPKVVFSSVADSISVILGCKYHQVGLNRHARAMWDNLLDETLHIISHLPELQEVPHRRDYFAQDSFRRKLQRHLVAQGTSTSPWISQVRMGDAPPVDYFNGYFVRRARELGLDHKHNTMAVETVKARARARRRELRLDLLGTSPYMMDNDAVAGDQSPPSFEEALELDLE
ncbi:hypothetical protein ONZ43_g4635 [Nemania bipapillata]|uniref:Uncharacterized protein n=1 Tax=Nemania bipapillata TaxID=110536 RepID=A0ACC2IK50_9PEZI|nr:hypothetical protein ONZ43_g4635 [Nemania bipapillata]